jgi:hypothetical protein
MSLEGIQARAHRLLPVPKDSHHISTRYGWPTRFIWSAWPTVSTTCDEECKTRKGSSGASDGPLYRIRKLPFKGWERLTRRTPTACFLGLRSETLSTMLPGAWLG